MLFARLRHSIGPPPTGHRETRIFADASGLLKQIASDGTITDLGGDGGGGSFDGGEITPATTPGLTIDVRGVDDGLALLALGNPVEDESRTLSVGSSDGAGGYQDVFTVWSDGSVSVLLAADAAGIFVTDNRVGPTNGALLLGVSPTATTLALPTPDSDAVSGLTRSYVAGEALAFGDPVYVKSDGKAWKADATSAGKFPAVGIAAAAIASGDSGLILLDGVATKSSWTWTVGGLLYLGAGGLTQTAPSGSGNCIQIVGYAESATVVRIDPELTYATHV